MSVTRSGNRISGAALGRGFANFVWGTGQMTISYKSCVSKSPKALINCCL